MDKNKIILLDTHAILHRFYHALPRMESLDGTPTQAVYGLTNVLLKIIDEYKPIKLFACFDRPEATNRELVYKEYKAHRPATKDDLKVQIELAKKLCEKFNVPVFEKAGYEAEDFIGSIIKNIKAELETQIIVVTGDLDTLQLVEGDRVVVCLLKKGFTETDIYNEARVIERFGFAPELLPDYKALVGDQSDNIKGIAGIGAKKGTDLVQKFGVVENIVQNANLIKEEKIRNEILGNKEILFLNKSLTTINRDISVGILGENYVGIDKEKILPFLGELNFKSIVRRLEAGGGKREMGDDVNYKIDFETDIKKFEKSLSENLEYIIFVSDGENLCVKSDIFYKIKPSAEILKNILNSPCRKITFNFKDLLKIIPENNFVGEFDANNVADIKIAFSIVYSVSTAANLNKIIGFYTGKIYSDVEAISEFLKLGKEAIISLEKQIIEMNSNDTYELEKSLIPVLARMEVNGLFLDSKNIEGFKFFLTTALKKLSAEIVNLAGEDFNINSPKVIRSILFEKLKISTKGISKTPKGEISTAESELLKIRGAHPIVEKILEYRELNKILTTYTDSLTNSIDEKTNRLHTHFEQIGAATGRITSQNPNLQNIPVKGNLASELRKCFKASENYSFIGLDYSQIELRLAAHLSGDENLKLAFLGNIDVHSLTAKLLFKKDDEKSRRFAKITNFGIIYGISAQGLKERLRIRRDEAQNIINDYFLKFSGLKQMRDEFIEKAKTKGYSETLFGRKRFIPEINSGSFRERAAAERAAINMPIQGLNADIIKKALIEIDKFLIEKKFYPAQAKIVLQIYDSIILEVNDIIIKEVEDEVKKIMENVVKLSVPMQVKINIGKDLSKI
ncbi:MAG: DNA polymerase I [Patescibacteria group bacterium]